MGLESWVRRCWGKAGHGVKIFFVAFGHSSVNKVLLRPHHSMARHSQLLDNSPLFTDVNKQLECKLESTIDDRGKWKFPTR